jgi:hypothetical protein
LSDTDGIEFRYPSSTGIARGNLLTGPIRATFGATFIDAGNLTSLTDAQQAASARHTVPAPAPRSSGQ